VSATSTQKEAFQKNDASQLNSSQPEPVSKRRPTRREGDQFFCVVAPGMTWGLPSEVTLSFLVFGIHYGIQGYGKWITELYLNEFAHDGIGFPFLFDKPE